MAGITNAAYRRLCLEQSRAQGGDSLFVCEMITSRGLVEGDAVGRQEWVAELVTYRDLLARIAQIDATRLEEVLDVDAG